MVTSAKILNTTLYGEHDWLALKELQSVPAGASIDLFHAYPELTTWMKSKKGKRGHTLFEVYQVVLTHYTTVGALKNEEIQNFEQKYNTDDTSSDTTWPICVRRCMANIHFFIRFTKSKSKRRREVLNGIEHNDTHKELLWALKYKCLNEWRRAVKMDALNDEKVRREILCVPSLDKEVNQAQWKKDQPAVSALALDKQQIVDPLADEAAYWKQRCLAAEGQNKQLQAYITSVVSRFSLKCQEAGDRLP
ncbi:MAG: hypothetical protein AAB870_00120 [Patescibacteria group bacterium]